MSISFGKSNFCRKIHCLKKSIVLLFFIVGLTQITEAQFGSLGSSGLRVRNNGSAADSAWNTVPEWKIGNGLTREQSKIRTENHNIKFMESGFKFWQMFPEDKRRYEWLDRMTGAFMPHFWTDISNGANTLLKAKGDFYNFPLDTAAQNKWMRILDSCGNVFLNDPEVSKGAKSAYKVAKVSQLLKNAYNISWRGSEKEFLSRLENALKVAITDLEEGSDNSRRLVLIMSELFLGSIKYSGSMKQLKEFINGFTDNGHSDIKKWALQKSALLNTNIEIFKLFNNPVIQGIDVERFRNKVVLVDFWNIYCSTCIARMPAIKSVFDKYHDQGFEVISANIDPESKKNKVEEVNKRINANWIHMIIGGNNTSSSTTAPWREIWKTYGFIGVPQLILFNKKGALVMINGPLLFDDPDELIRDLVKE